MSKIALSGNASGTGTLTIAAPNTNTDRILNLPDSAGTLATAESTLTQFNASGSAPVYAARAWVNFDGTGTVAIRASGNVSSITDNGTGLYTVNFTSALPDASYSLVASGQALASAVTISVYAAAADPSPMTTTSCPIAARSDSGSALDTSTVSVAVFR